MASRTPSAPRAASATSARKPLQMSSSANGPLATLRSATKRPRDAGIAPASAAKAKSADIASEGGLGHSGSTEGKSNGMTMGPVSSGMASSIARLPTGQPPAHSILTAVRIKPCDADQRDGFEEGCGAVTRGKDGRIRIEMSSEAAGPEPSASGAPRSVMKAFAPEHVFLGTTGQAEVYETFAKDIVLAVLGGTNGCLTAYGQTGSGKTHTMLGDPTSPSEQGVIPRALRTLFNGIHALKADTEGTAPGARVDARIKASYVEVYQENVYDLLAKEEGSGGGPGWAGAFSGNAGNGAVIPGGPRLLRIRGDDTSGFFLDGVAEVELTDAETALDVLAAGFGARRTTATAMNARSSRSHAILSLTVTVRITHPPMAGESVDRLQEREAVLDVVDLAGSERQRDTGAEGSALKEAGKINNSLSHLAEVIKTLLENSMAKHSKAARPVPWRNSKLTMLLRRSLAGNSRTAMIFAISPATEYWSESVNTLMFADRARKLKTEPSTNERTVLMGGTSAQLTVLTKELAMAKALIVQLRAAIVGGGSAGSVADIAALLGNGMDADPSARALDFTFSVSTSTTLTRPWAGLSVESGCEAGMDVLGPQVGAQVHRLLDRVAIAGEGMTTAASRLVSRLSAPGSDVLVRLAVDSLVHKATLAAMSMNPAAGGHELVAGLSEVAQQVVAIVMAQAQAATLPVTACALAHGAELEAAERSPKLRRFAEDEDTGSARQRSSTGSEGTPRMSAAFDFDRGFGGFDAPAPGTGAVPRTTSLPVEAILAAVKAALLTETSGSHGPAQAIAALSTALGMPTTRHGDSLNLPLLIPALDARQVAGLLASGTETLDETGRCIPSLFDECKKLSMKAQSFEEQLASARAAGPGHNGGGLKSRQPAKAVPSSGISGTSAGHEIMCLPSTFSEMHDGPGVEMSTQPHLPFANDMSADGCEELHGTGAGAVARLSSRASLAALSVMRNDGLSIAFKTAAERMEPNAKPRVSHLAPAEIARRADASSRVRSSSMASTSSITASRNESLGGGEGGGGRPSDVEVFGLQSGPGTMEGEVEHEHEGMLAGDDMGAADMPMPRSFQRDHAMMDHDGECDHDLDMHSMMPVPGGSHRLPYSQGGGAAECTLDGPPSARVSCVSRASTGTDVGTTVSEHIERQNALNVSGPLALAMSGTYMLQPPARMQAPSAVGPAPVAVPVPVPVANPAFVAKAPVPSDKPLPLLSAMIKSVAVPPLPAPAHAVVPVSSAAPINLLKPAPAAKPVAAASLAANKPASVRATTPASVSARRMPTASSAKPASAAPVSAPMPHESVSVAAKPFGLASFIKTVDTSKR